MNFRSILLRLIKYVPSFFVKVVILKHGLGYEIRENVYIGKVYFNCKKVTFGDNVKIAN